MVKVHRARGMPARRGRPSSSCSLVRCPSQVHRHSPAAVPPPRASSAAQGAATTRHRGASGPAGARAAASAGPGAAIAH